MASFKRLEPDASVGASHDRQSLSPDGAGDTLRDVVANWLAALAGRAAYVVHALAGHRVEWTRSTPEANCPGDIVCENCEQVLWCRAHDPWGTPGDDGIVDHWGATCPRPSPRPLLDVLDHVLRLADRCPRDMTGNDVRRMACRLIEAVSTRERRLLRRRLLARLDRLDRTRLVTPDERGAVQRLTDIVRNELPHVAAAAAGSRGVRHPGTAAPR